MFVVGNLIAGIAGVLNQLLYFYSMILLVAVLITWVSPDPRNPIVRFLRAVTEPVLHEVRKRLPFTYTSGIDFSPIVVLLVIQFLQSVLVQSLYDLARRLG